MVRKLVLCSAILLSGAVSAQIKRPKLVVGIMIDQMRWDYLYRYYDRYPEGGFKRLLNGGFKCENTMIPYIPTYTACGHSCVYTGSVPAVHGMTGNSWFDNDKGREVYCTEDDSVQTVGSTSDEGKESPRNLLATTVTDELRLATNFGSKVIGISFKDRASILPAGHLANAAYWYDHKTGAFITSTYYQKDLPDWVKAFNAQKLPDAYYKEGWNTVYPLASYTESTADSVAWEGTPFGPDQTHFPYNLSRFVGKNYGALGTTPFGNSIVEEMCKAALTGENLGKGEHTDFLAVSFSSTDYVGHAFGPNSIEAEDTYLRLDRTLADLLATLDEKVGKGQYLVFLTADHGAAHAAGFLQEHNVPAGTVSLAAWRKGLEDRIEKVFFTPRLIRDVLNYQVYLNRPLMDSMMLDPRKVENEVVKYLMAQPGVARAFALDRMDNEPLPEVIRTSVENGYFPRRSGDIQVILMPAWMEGFKTGTTHGLWNPYDAHIPLVWFGWGVKPGSLHRTVYMTDIAVTLAAMLHIQMPNGAVGHVIEEVAD
ncbi:alkaline phosphatase PafA [Dinghuibacter silviterrae]|uniref:Putative AlkP superfamily pyrophosphatase or phosphodiesterase n=1 Tax=Dinghuibacter silviterrae TaxID=1539049 RepID=A0A4R8DR98_9BACT|nr:alkaline phosphatase PafA [Dinghuibacter silviterrae]TDX00712.1 putative AlkP superfamily pyrophosphatase or phosphodiesterase [Dinghuibacter silviterrae]